MSKNTRIYCVYCGTENILENKKCKKCKKDLDPKNRPIRDYIYDKIKDKVDGDIQDNIFSLITNFIKKHLYGTVLTCSVVITAVSIVTNVVSNGNGFEIVKERPDIIQKYEYAGTGMTSDAITNVYLNALNSGDLNTMKRYELRTFYPELYDDLKDVPYNSGSHGQINLLQEHNLYTNREALFKQEEIYGIGSSYGCVAEGNYGEYKFVRYPIFNIYCYSGDCSSTDNKYQIVNDIELLEVDGNYYITGSVKEIGMSIDQDINYELLLQYNGDTTKFNYDDVNEYIDEIDG